MKRLPFLLLTVLAFISCDKEENEPETIVGTWAQVEVYTVDNNGNRSQNFIEFISECEKDNLYQFTVSNDFYIKEGDNVCQPSDEHSDKYALSENGTTITFQNWPDGSISSLTKSSFTLTQPLSPFTGYRDVITVFKRK